MSEPTSVQGFVTYCLAVCKNGFENEHAWQAWLRVRQARIDRLPRPLRERVLAAHTNSGPKEISK